MLLMSPTTPTIESRLQVGLRNPRSISRNIRASAGGLAVHHGGASQGIPATVKHTICRARVRGWQDYHMDGKGWVDLAYSWVVCQHGTVMTGRGFGVRTAANGTNDANDRYLACCWLGGGSETPTPAALNGIEWLIGEIRRRGAGRDVKPHRAFFGTDCPGSLLAHQTPNWTIAIIGDRATTPATPGARPATVPPFPLARGQYFGPKDGGKNSISGFYGHRSDLARWQAAAFTRNPSLTRLQADGLYGPKTAAWVRAFQAKRLVGVDGLIGPTTWGLAWR